MKNKDENGKFTLEYCRKILNSDERKYTDEEVIKIRDWLYEWAKIEVEVFREHQRKRENEAKPL